MTSRLSIASYHLSCSDFTTIPSLLSYLLQPFKGQPVGFKYFFHPDANILAILSHPHQSHDKLEEGLSGYKMKDKFVCIDLTRNLH